MRISAYRSIFSFLFLILIFAGLTSLVNSQNSDSAAMDNFYSEWTKAIGRGDRWAARQLVSENRELAKKVANFVGLHARKEFKSGNTDNAIAVLTAALNLFEDLEDKKGAAIALNDLGVVYEETGDCESALRYFSHAAQVARELEDTKLLGISANGIQACIFRISVASTNLQGIANLAQTRDGDQVVVVHPQKCKEAGFEVCGFYLVHEYAHIHLEHATYDVPAIKSEPDADCWAAMHISRDWAEAAYRWFLNGAPSPSVHGSSAKRAERIRRCAGF